MEPLSVAIITLNEERNLPDCLRRLSFADEIVVVDSGSTDRTRELAEAAGARVIVHPFAGHIEQKNYALAQCRHEWVLSLDADERLSPELQAAVRAAPADGADGYLMNRRSFYLGDWFTRGGWYPDRRLRLFRRTKASWRGENPHDHAWVDGPVRRLRGDILHYVYDDLAHHLRVINSFSAITAEAKAGRGRRGRPGAMLWHPLAKFLKVYFVQRACLSGWRGFVMAVMGSFSVFMKYAKLWERERGFRRA